MLSGFPSALEGVFVMKSGLVRASSSTISRPISQVRKLRHKDPCSMSHNQHLAELDFETTCVLSQPKYRKAAKELVHSSDQYKQAGRVWSCITCGRKALVSNAVRSRLTVKSFLWPARTPQNFFSRSSCCDRSQITNQHSKDIDRTSGSYTALLPPPSSRDAPQTLEKPRAW